MQRGATIAQALPGPCHCCLLSQRGTACPSSIIPDLMAKHIVRRFGTSKKALYKSRHIAHLGHLHTMARAEGQPPPPSKLWEGRADRPCVVLLQFGPPATAEPPAPAPAALGPKPHDTARAATVAVSHGRFLVLPHLTA